MNDTYHHGNLRAELIEAGIDILTREGYGNLSLRKVAKACGVSHAAPYNHFKDKDELLAAMHPHMEALLFGELRRAAESAPEDGMLCAIGKAYIYFFKRHPQYFRFMQDQDNAKIVISRLHGISGDSGAFNVFGEIAGQFLDNLGLTGGDRADAVAAMWAYVHGLAGMATMQSLVYDGDWGDLIEKMLNQTLFSPKE